MEASDFIFKHFTLSAVEIEKVFLSTEKDKYLDDVNMLLPKYNLPALCRKEDKL